MGLDSLILVNQDFYERASAAVRWKEREEKSISHGMDEGSMIGPTGWHVKVTGPSFEVTTTTDTSTSSTTGTATSSTGTTTTTTGACQSGGGTATCTWVCDTTISETVGGFTYGVWVMTTPCPGGCDCVPMLPAFTPGPPFNCFDDGGVSHNSICLANSGTTSTFTTTRKKVRLYPGRVLFRDMNKDSTGDAWYDCCTDLYIQEIQDRPLGQGCRYVGDVIENYNGRAVVAVANHVTPTVDCSTTTPTTSSTVACSGECEFTYDVDTGTWVQSSSSCPTGCGCPLPSFCPEGGAVCATTRTVCFRGYVAPSGIGQCKSSSTSATTTTTPNPSGCGTGCVFKNVPGKGIVILSSDCPNVGNVIGTQADGTTYVCSSCSAPSLLPCQTGATPCEVLVIPPPQCAGSCRWIGTGEAQYGGGWILLYYGCASTGWESIGSTPSDIVGCGCVRPPGIGVCGVQTDTPCYVPGSSGTGTTTVPGCRGTCQYRWSTDDDAWVKISDCGPNCDCQEPTADGVDNCSTSQNPCKDTTTGTGTTTTTSGTGTTTTTSRPDCKDSCVYLCTPDGWVQLTSCKDDACTCNMPPDRPGSECVWGEVGGITSSTTCFQSPPTSSTSATSSTTSKCTTCGWSCDGNTWVLVYNDCGTGCRCIYPTAGCDPSSSEETVHYLCASADGSGGLTGDTTGTGGAVVIA